LWSWIGLGDDYHFGDALLGKGPIDNIGSSFCISVAEMVAEMRPFRDEDFEKSLRKMKPSKKDIKILGRGLISKVFLTAPLMLCFGGPKKMLASLKLEKETAEKDKNPHIGMPSWHVEKIARVAKRNDDIYISTLTAKT
jgi:hypothetical protein